MLRSLCFFENENLATRAHARARGKIRRFFFIKLRKYSKVPIFENHKKV